MKKTFIILLAFITFTACDTEPLDRDVLDAANDQNDNDNGGNNPDILALSAYSYDVNTAVPFLGAIIINSDFSFNNNNKASSALVVSTFLGQSSTENLIYGRDTTNRINSVISNASGAVTNETTIVYDGGNISQIIYDFVEDDEDDYTYNFEYSGNTITRTEVGSTISTVFTLNGANQLIKKESFDGLTSIKTEVIDYDGLGNCISSIITGEDATSLSFEFDQNDNPLYDAFRDQYLLSFLNDDYSDAVGGTFAQFSSPNNWISITAPEATVDFVIDYDDDSRITSRNANYDLGDGVSIQQAETFSFIN